MTTDLKDIIVRPRWFRWAYLVMFVVLVVFTFMVLNDLTARINEANDRADTNEQGVKALADQVEGLGGTPVVTPEELPQPGEPGPAGVAGIAGAIGLTGPAGRDGQDGTDGTDGADGAPGVPGQDGLDGQNGAPGASGADGSTVAGPIGPQGPEGPRGPAGQDGANGRDGVDGADGADGQACPDGYSLEQRTIISAENPLGEPGFVCVADDSPGTTEPTQTPVRN